MRRLLTWVLILAWASAAQAQSTAPTPVTLKPGDTLSISVLQDPKLDRSVVVDPNGQIAFPLAGHITANGLTPQRLEKILKARLKRNYKDDDLDVTVALTNAARDVPEDDLKPKIFITGEVLRPGPYPIRQAFTVVQAISIAGGLGPFAAKKRIQIHRRNGDGEETIFKFDYKAYEAGQDVEADIQLQAGDVIIVPERGLLE